MRGKGKTVLSYGTLGFRLRYQELHPDRKPQWAVHQHNAINFWSLHHWRLSFQRAFHSPHAQGSTDPFFNLSLMTVPCGNTKQTFHSPLPLVVYCHDSCIQWDLSFLCSLSLLCSQSTETPTTLANGTGEFRATKNKAHLMLQYQHLQGWF